MKKQDIDKVYLLATEGTILSRVYSTKLNEANIKCETQNEEEFFYLREIIEAVKQNKYDDNIKKIFLELVHRADYCILGCTELPILYDRYREEIKGVQVYDPIYMALNVIKERYMELD